jgi:simple sugar transport system permease protein
MMNYVAIQLCAYFIILWEKPKGSGKVGIINQSSHAGWLPVIGRYKYLLTVIVAAAVTVFIFCYMKYSKHGYELAVVGESQNTARYVGIRVGRVIVRTMLLSGAICGLTGFMLVAGSDHTITTTLANGRGFTAVLVAWMAKFNPFGMIFTSFLITFMSKGAGEVATNFNLNESFSDILTSIIIFFLIGCEFFIQYRIVRKKEAK